MLHELVKRPGTLRPWRIVDASTSRTVFTFAPADGAFAERTLAALNEGQAA